MDLGLTGKTALVTGGSRGIGKAIALALASEGCDVAITARGLEALSGTAEELRSATGRKVLAVQGDTSDSTSVRDMVGQVVAQFGRVDILINNAARAGAAPPVPGIENLADDSFTTEMNTKVLGYVRCAREVVPGMKAAGWGRIVNVSGLAARQTGNPTRSAACGTLPSLH